MVSSQKDVQYNVAICRGFLRLTILSSEFLDPAHHYKFSCCNYVASIIHMGALKISAV